MKNSFDDFKVLRSHVIEEKNFYFVEWDVYKSKNWLVCFSFSTVINHTIILISQFSLWSS